MLISVRNLSDLNLIYETSII